MVSVRPPSVLPLLGLMLARTRTSRAIHSHKPFSYMHWAVCTSAGSLQKISFQLQDSCLADCKFFLVKTQFCRTVLYVIIVILEIFARHLSDRIKYFVSQSEILLVLTDRPTVFMKTELAEFIFIFQNCLEL